MRHIIYMCTTCYCRLYKSIACLLLFPLSDAFGAVIHLILKKDEWCRDTLWTHDVMTHFGLGMNSGCPLQVPVVHTTRPKVCISSIRHILNRQKGSQGRAGWWNKQGVQKAWPTWTTKWRSHYTGTRDLLVPLSNPQFSNLKEFRYDAKGTCMMVATTVVSAVNFCNLTKRNKKNEQKH